MSVLLVPANENHLAVFDPLHEDMKRRGLDYSYLICSQMLYEKVKKNEEKTYSFSCGFDKIYKEKNKIVKKLFLFFYYFKSRRRFILFLKKNNIKVIVVGNDGTNVVKPLLTIARNKGYRVLMLQDGNYNGLKNNVRETKMKRVLTSIKFLKPFFSTVVGGVSDVVATYGEISKGILKKFHPHTDVRVTGSPKHSALMIAYENRVKHKLIASKEKKSLLFCTSNYKNSYLLNCHDAQYKILERIIEIVNISDNLTLIIRLHPKENRLMYDSVKESTKVSISENTDLLEDLVDSNVVLTSGGTIIVDSAVCNLPSYQVLTEECLLDYECENFNSIKSFEELSKTLSDISMSKEIVDFSLSKRASGELADLTSGWNSVYKVCDVISELSI